MQEHLLFERSEFHARELAPLLCAHRHDKGGLLDIMRDGGLAAGFSRAIVGQIDRDKCSSSRSAKMGRRTIDTLRKLHGENL
jgi:hypothetical protein